MRAGRAVGYLWPGMIAAGLALAAAVWAAWPEPTVRTMRLPYGEALPKSPRAAAPAVREEIVAPSAEAAAVAPPSIEEPRAPAASTEPETAQAEEQGRVLAVVEPTPAPTRAPAAPAAAAQATEQVDERWGPDPIPSELDALPGYEPESPEELGVEPLPGFTQPEPPAAG